ncbi:hypothetical protein LCGC14_3133030 [marine sediment metagenome]|uniref:PsbP C-terminal domain-containing protein n=1 Tax=marine sediment metagenome TaxID=412755 RepID=A0A0F8WMZ9_9ZZZZ
MKKCMIAVLLVACCALCLAAVSSGRMHFKTAGFSIQPLDAKPGTSTYQAMMMFLPPSGGFAPNVNVQIQPYAGTIDEYVALSRKEFLARKLKKVNEAKLGKTGFLFEYTGNVRGVSMHWYSKAVSTGKRVYLASATAPEAQWPAVSAKLKACVDSLRVDEGKPATVPARRP